MQHPTERLEAMRAEALKGGGEARIEAQHGKGKLTARERLQLLLDPGTFQEMGQLVTHRSTNFGLDKQKFLGDGVVTGYGKVNGRLVYVFSQDFTVLGGSLAEAHAQKICKIMDMALENGAPVIGLNDSGGARIQEGVVSLGGYADIFHRNVKASGVVPQLSLILGPCAGGAVYSPALTDFIFMAEGTSYMFVTGPNVVKTVTHEEVTSEELGGASTHASKSGVTHFTAANEALVIEHAKKVLSFLPQNCEEDPDRLVYQGGDESRPKLDNLVPESAQQPYDIRDAVGEILDADSFLEVQPDFAENIVVGFGRLAGRSVGVVANQPAFLAGVLDNDASTKAARRRLHLRTTRLRLRRLPSRRRARRHARAPRLRARTRRVPPAPRRAPQAARPFLPARGHPGRRRRGEEARPGEQTALGRRDGAPAAERAERGERVSRQLRRRPRGLRRQRRQRYGAFLAAPRVLVQHLSGNLAWS